MTRLGVKQAAGGAASFPGAGDCAVALVTSRAAIADKSADHLQMGARRSAPLARRSRALQLCWIRTNLSDPEKSSVHFSSSHTGDFEELRNFGMCGNDRRDAIEAIFRGDPKNVCGA